MANLTKWSIVVIIAASLVGLAVIFLGPTLMKQKEVPDMIASDTVSPAAIPALDGAAPANTETATFALG